MANLKLFLLSTLLIGLMACGDTASAPEAPAAPTAPATPSAPSTETTPPADATTPETAPATPTPPKAVGEPVYTWTTALNIRDKPSTSGEIVATVKPKDALQPTGERTPEKSAITLRGRTFTEPWIQVTTPSGKTGWVFGGAVLSSAMHDSKILQELDRGSGENCPLVGTREDPMDGCSCGFNTSTGKSMFVLDVSFANRACVTLNGETYQMDGYYDGYGYLDTKDPWIVLTDDDWTLFGGKADFGDADLIIRRLADALLSFDKIPSEVPLKNEMTAGMAVREVRDLGTDAVAQAKKRRAAGERSGDVRMEYWNDKYRVILTGNTYFEPLSDTGTNYEALIQVEDSKGNVLTDAAVKGHCGC